MHANDWDAIDEVRRVVGTQVDADRLADESVDLADSVTSTGRHPPRLAGARCGHPPGHR